LKIVTEFGARFKQLRLELNLSQEDIALKLGIDVSSVNRYEKNKREPEYATLLKIAAFFDVSADYLLGGTDNRKRL
jgi:transcriptional regulator with XRE-family HTH domain